jgi:hypothetical protein
VREKADRILAERPDLVEPVARFARDAGCTTQQDVYELIYGMRMASGETGLRTQQFLR